MLCEQYVPLWHTRCKGLWCTAAAALAASEPDMAT